MALMTCQYYSFTLKHTVEINVFIPTPEGNEQIASEQSKLKFNYEANFRPAFPTIQKEPGHSDCAAPGSSCISYAAINCLWPGWSG